MTYGRKESFLGAWSQLGGPWCRLGGPWSRLGGPWSRLGGPLSRLGGPRSREKISLISEAVRRPRKADYEIFKRARATHTSSFKSHKYIVTSGYRTPVQTIFDRDILVLDHSGRLVVTSKILHFRLYPIVVDVVSRWNLSWVLFGSHLASLEVLGEALPTRTISWHDCWDVDSMSLYCLVLSTLPSNPPSPSVRLNPNHPLLYSL